MLADLTLSHEACCSVITSRSGDVLTNWELFMLHQLHEDGLTISEIARRSGLDRKTVRKYIQRGLTAPSYGPRAPRPQVLDPYVDYLQAWRANLLDAGQG